MSIHSPEDPSPLDVVRVVRRHRKKVMLFVTLVVACTAVAVVVLPKVYTSESKLLVLVGRESVSLDPVVAHGETMGISTSRDTEINTLLEMLKSEAVLSKVVDELGADVVLAPPEDQGMYRRGKRLISDAKNDLRTQIKQWMGQTDGPSSDFDPSMNPNEEAIQVLDGSLDVAATKNTTVVTVTANSHSPALAQKFVSALVDVYSRNHMKLYSTEGSEEFFRSQKQLVGTQLADQRATLNALKSEMGIGSAEAEYIRLEAEKATIESLRKSLARELDGTRASCETLEKAIESSEEVILAGRVEGLSNGATDGIRQLLYSLELAEGEASEKYTEGHPELRRIRAQLKVMRTRFESEENERTTTNFARNPGREALVAQLDLKQTLAADLTAQLLAADRQGEVVLASLERLNESSGELDQLVQDVAFLERSYDTYSDSLEQSRIGASLAQQQISNVNVAQPATYVSEPVSPNRMLVAGSGLLFAILGGVALALMMEYLDNRLKSPTEVEEFTELPVMVALPRKSRPVQIPQLAKGSRK